MFEEMFVVIATISRVDYLKKWKEKTLSIYPLELKPFRSILSSITYIGFHLKFNT